MGAAPTPIESQLHDRLLVDHLQSKLNDTRFPGAGNLSAAARNATGNRRDRRSCTSPQGCRSCSLRSTERVRQIEVRMVKEVVKLRAELDLQALDRGVEVLIQREVCLVERRRPPRIP